jgi:hypothetical protein
MAYAGSGFSNWATTAALIVRKGGGAGEFELVPVLVGVTGLVEFPELERVPLLGDEGVVVEGVASAAAAVAAV